ncbi:hypothetical protein INT43_008972 [Umbelopsis isabellina]|uniref:DNA 3'-5' helicase n=1 Tax=Mortierella isabellina TaxID=91625 RepID=A0A8H7UJM1_MORIS|nr:hypothetical protein INT43_008972 [Umbelopsis isabellina]
MPLLHQIGFYRSWLVQDPERQEVGTPYTSQNSPMTTLLLKYGFYLSFFFIYIVTAVLTARVAWFVKEKGINPRNILVVTFTNKAANEMRARLSSEDFLGDTSKQLLMGTFHSFCANFLRRHGSRIGIPNNFTIADSEDSQKIVKEIAKELNINDNASYLRGQISSAKCQGMTHQAYEAKYLQERRNVCLVFSAYQKRLLQNNALDFDDLLLEGCRLFEKHPDVASFLRYILVDEYQDTNAVQYDLIKLVMDYQKSLTIVGDPDQSIYGFRNADVTNFNKMHTDYKNVTTICLEQNYRSTLSILQAASIVINNDSSRIPKNLITDNCKGQPMSWLKFQTPEEEAFEVAQEIIRVQKYTHGLLHNDDFVILVRNNRQSRSFEQALSKFQIPYRMRGGTRFFDRAEIKDILAYLRLIVNPKDNDAFVRAINVPKRGVGDATLARIRKVANDNNWTMMQALTEITSENNSGRNNPTITRALNGQTLENIKSFLELLKSLQVIAEAKGSIGVMIETIVETTNYKNYLYKIHFPKAGNQWEDHWENVEELMTYANRFVSTSEADIFQDVVERDALLDFLESACLDSQGYNEDENGNEKRCVTISTYHSAKGLEWPCVFCTACEEGLIPSWRSTTAAAIHEDCRLLYVGMTRAQCFLYCTSVALRAQPNINDMRDCTSTRFLENMPVDLFDDNKYPDLNQTEREWLSTLLDRSLPEGDKNLKSDGNYITAMRHDFGTIQGLHSPTPRSAAQQTNGTGSWTAFPSAKATFGMQSSTTYGGFRSAKNVRSRAQDQPSGSNNRKTVSALGGFMPASQINEPPLEAVVKKESNNKKFFMPHEVHKSLQQPSTEPNIKLEPFEVRLNGNYGKNEAAMQRGAIRSDSTHLMLSSKRPDGENGVSKRKKVKQEVDEEPISSDMGKKASESSGYQSIWRRYLNKGSEDLDLKRFENDLSRIIIDCLKVIPNERGELTEELATNIVVKRAIQKNMAVTKMDIEFRVRDELQKLVDQNVLYKKKVGTVDMYIISN